jgi:antitoxin PrlF
MPNKPKRDKTSNTATGSAESGPLVAPIVDADQYWRLKVAQNGRLVIPAALRAAMRLDASGMVTARMVDGELKLITPVVAVEKLQALVKHHAGERSLVDELIAERRAEAERE